jgi:hypothetical protein
VLHNYLNADNGRGMKDWTTIRDRYLRDNVSVRLGGLAANLRRIKSFAGHDANLAVVESLLEESKFFIEWTAREADIDTAAELVEFQIQLARWQHYWPTLWTDRYNAVEWRNNRV